MAKIKVVAALVFFILFAVKTVQAKELPDTTNMSDNKLLRLAHKNVRKDNLADAVFFYNAWLRRHPGDFDIMYKIANMQYIMENYGASANLYTKIAKGNPPKNGLVKEWYTRNKKGRYTSSYQKYKTAFYYAGMSQQRNEEYEASNESYYAFINQCQDSECAVWIKRAKIEIERNNFAIWLLKQATKYEVTGFIPGPPYEPISGYPQLYGDSLVAFETLKLAKFLNIYRPVSEFSTAIPRRDNWKYYYLSAKRHPKEIWEWKNQGPAYQFPHSMYYMVLGGCFSPDRHRYYFTQCDVHVNQFAYELGGPRYIFNNFSIYYCDVHRDRFAKPVRLDSNINLPGTVNIMPGVGKDKNNQDVLYFASNRPGGLGGFDIWQSTYNSKKKYFEAAINPGPAINTSGHEVTPYFDVDSSILYFSTDKRPGLGGFDVYSCHYKNNAWDSCVNLGAIINSGKNEMYFALDSKHNHGVFSKVCRCPGLPCISGLYDGLPFFGCQQMYSCKLKLPQPVVRVYAMTGKDKKPTPGIALELYAINPKNQKKQILRKKVIQDSIHYMQVPLQLRTAYHIHASKEGYLPVDTSFNTDSIKHSDTLVFNLNLRAIPIDTPIVIRDIVFEFNDSILTKESQKILDTTLLRYMQKNITQKIMILSHADSVGTDEYNMHLSQLRADAVVNYLISKGISPHRLVAKGYGNKHPIAPNRNKDGSDNPEGRRLNRRTEFKIMK